MYFIQDINSPTRPHLHRFARQIVAPYAWTGRCACGASVGHLPLASLGYAHLHCNTPYRAGSAAHVSQSPNPEGRVSETIFCIGFGFGEGLATWCGNEIAPPVSDRRRSIVYL